jgi:solute carrier family 25 (mitochondrial carnitine/acylcarnitine transporter), member 20/29
MTFGIDLLSGIAGGSAGVLVGHPFDTLKVRLQTQQIGQKMGMVKVVQKIVKNEGVPSAN